MPDLSLFKQFLRSPTRVGAIAPSGPALVAEMVGGFDFSAGGELLQFDAVLEYGPGTGVFTEAIAAAIPNDCRFVAIERSESLVDQTRRRCPNVDVHHGDVTDVREICDRRGISEVDAIVCGLPWASLPAGVQDAIFESMFRVLRPGGQFATFAYLQGVPLPTARRFAAKLRNRFTRVRRSPIVWRNLPPAFIYRCVR